MYSFISKPVPFYQVVLAAICVGFFTYAFSRYYGNDSAAAGNKPVSALPTPVPVKDCDLVSTRIGGFNFIRPLMFAEAGCESMSLEPIKSEADRLVNLFKLSGDISTASVYLREFDHGQWMEYNGDETYHPASLIKVPIMMAVLKMADATPGLLDKEIVFDGIPKEMLRSKQNYISDTITLGKKYTVRELLRYMIAFSDNDAQQLLIKSLNPTNFDRMFMDLGIGLPMDQNSKQILISAKAYSAFLKTLFNATYLGTAKSEYALSLMHDCSFKDGFAKGLPTDTKMIHKFGEWDDMHDFELHESGIIYFQNKAYLLTIMTRGGNRSKLPNVISSITKAIYDQLGKLP